MSINGKWLYKIASEAIALQRVPLVELRFDGQTGPAPTDWVMMPAIEFEMLLEQVRES